MAKVVAQGISRALGMAIAKFKIIGDVPYDVFIKFYYFIVWLVIA